MADFRTKEQFALKLINRILNFPWYTRAVLGLVAFVFVGLVALFFLFRYELRTSSFQSKWIHYLSKQCSYTVVQGASSRIRFPSPAPYDKRTGYALIDQFSEQLLKKNFVVSKQAEISRRHAALIDLGVFPIYQEKSQHGISILGANSNIIYNKLTPERVYKTFKDIPALVLDTLLFIEDRDLLSKLSTSHNPAVEWDRFARAMMDLGVKFINPDHHVQGGSTLATQIEKYRHSKAGRTGSPTEKLRQMASAALRAYHGGRNTVAVRQAIAKSYIDTVPLAAVRGFGEVQGLGDGLWAYYEQDLEQLASVLNKKLGASDSKLLQEQGAAYRKVLSIFLAHRRPSEFFGPNPALLEQKVQGYLPLLYKNGIIPEILFKSAYNQKTSYRRSIPEVEADSFVDRKASNRIRSELLRLLKIKSLYDLDRFDLSVNTTFNNIAQTQATQTLTKMKDKRFVKSRSLSGFRLLNTNTDLSKVIYSLTVYEKADGVNLLRLQTDSNDQPFNLNEGGRLDLGSTAKLRTLVSYLEIIHELFDQFYKLDLDHKKKLLKEEVDPLSKWILRALIANQDHTIDSILKAAMARQYSGSTAAKFFTAGGVHKFSNFNAKHNTGSYSIAYALRHSINLPFIRLMSDIVKYLSVKAAGVMPHEALKLDAEKQLEYLKRFAEKEGKQFVRKFWKIYKRQSRESLLRKYVAKKSRKLQKLALAFWFLHPHLTEEQFESFLNSVPDYKVPSKKLIEQTWKMVTDPATSLADKAFTARVHPLDMWVFARLLSDSDTKLRTLLGEGQAVRQAAYEWLFKTKSKHKRDRRIRVILEQDAFELLHKRWLQLGYGMRHLVPSLATALGSSADKPSSLSILLGIIVNDGVKLPTKVVDRISFGEATPFETSFEYRPPPAKRVLSSSVAKVIKEALYDVVKNGTAIRLKRGLKTEGNKFLKVGGKTGTGDHRYKVYSNVGVLTESRVVNRTATFMFIIDDRFFGTISAFVPGTQAKNYKFTSSLPVALMKVLSKDLAPLLK